MNLAATVAEGGVAAGPAACIDTGSN